jgi:hypothetical protein
MGSAVISGLSSIGLTGSTHLPAQQVAFGDQVVKRYKMKCKVPIEFEFEIHVVTGKGSPHFKVTKSSASLAKDRCARVLTTVAISHGLKGPPPSRHLL